ncbi:L,D-transpeptidase [Chloroflexi bacterium TSY]|nr:L,D-transpeptidase [Chloroflexi bacterium TSY]
MLASTLSVAAQSAIKNNELRETPQINVDESTSLISIDNIPRPPLPFAQPQVGPLIKRALDADIDHRTTAFTPIESENTDFEFPDVAENERWIRVNLAEQSLTAYLGEQPLRSFLISSGLPHYPTVTGEFRIRMKVSEQVMSGGTPGTSSYYNLPNVRWVMYFFEDYALHGSYWHNNFGNPMSHGCVNMTNADAKWLFDWSGPVWDGETVWYRPTKDNPGTRVIVHN